MPAQTQWLIALVILGGAASIAYEVWQYHTAKEIAETWLLQHKYKVHSLRRAWFSLNHFWPKMFRREERSVEFRVILTDQQLGGTGELWMRVWVDRTGLIDREPELSWEKMPTREKTESETLEERNRKAQLSLLRQIESGTTRFVAEHSDDAAFDESVEHLLALQKRDLITCTIRNSRRPGRLYDVVDNAELTVTGRGYLKLLTT
jgi:hypothetical protein